jgi:hypothetical protein
MSKALLSDYTRNYQLLAAYQAELDGGVPVADTVRGSMRGFPYVERVIPVSGTDAERARWLRARVRTLRAKCLRAERFVDAVEDERMRALLYWHYICGLSWTKVRRMIGIRKVGPDALRMQVDRFFAKKGP